MRGFFFCSFFACCCSAFAGTAVLPIDAAGMGADEARLKKDVADVLKDVLKERYTAVPEAAVDTSARCAQTMTCLQKAASLASADDVAWVKIAPATLTKGKAGDAWATVTIALFNPDGTPLLTFTRTLTTSQAQRDLRSVVVEAFDPARYTGRAVFTGLQTGDELLVDGLRPERSELLLRPGPHRARITHVDGSVADVAFVVPYEGKVFVEVPAAGVQGALRPPPFWPAWVHGAVGVVGVIGLSSVLGREIIWRDSAELLDRGTCPVGGVDSSGGNFENQGVSSLGPCGAVQVEQHQWVQLNRDLHFTLSLGFTFVTLTAGAAAAATVLLQPAPAE